MEIVNSADVAYEGKGYTPTASLKRVVLHDMAIFQILAFLETDPEISKRYLAFITSVEEAEKAKLVAAEARRQAQIAAQKALMLKQEQEAIDVAAKEAEARKAQIAAQLAELNGVVTAAPVAEKIAAEKVADSPVADINGDGKIDKSEMIARLKADGVTVDESAHWKTIEKQYTAKYGK